MVIDRLLRERADAGADADEEATEVVYVSPLKALAADIQQNLEAPLAEIRATRRRELGLRRARAARAPAHGRHARRPRGPP